MKKHEPPKETVENFLERGGVITRYPPAKEPAPVHMDACVGCECNKPMGSILAMSHNGTWRSGASN